MDRMASIAAEGISQKQGPIYLQINLRVLLSQGVGTEFSGLIDFKK